MHSSQSIWSNRRLTFVAPMGVRKFILKIPQPYLRSENYYARKILRACLACSDVTSGSPLLILPSQTAATVEMLMISVPPQTEHLHRKANGLTSTTQLQLVSGCFIGASPYEPWGRRIAQ